MKYKIIVIIGLILIISGCTKEEKITEEKPIPITLSQVEKVSMSMPIITSGKVSAGVETLLSFKTGGIVEKVYVSEGQSVKRGEVLAQLDLSEIKAKVSQATEGLKKAKRDFERITSLYQDSVVTLEQFQNVETALKVAEANSEIADFNLNYSKIIAPSKGKILRKFVEENQLVSPGTPIIQFGSTDSNWKIKCGISDSHISKIKLGNKANISFDVFPSKIIKGTVTEIASSANPMTGTFEVEISIENFNGIISGMVANIEINSSTIFNGYLVPIQSIIEAEGSSASVFVLSQNNNTVKRVKVEIGEIVNDKVLVKNSEVELNKVVTEGVEYVTENSKIKVVEQREIK